MLILDWMRMRYFSDLPQRIMSHTAFHESSGPIMNYHEVSWLIMNRHDLSWIIMTYHESSWLIMNHHDLSWIIMTYHESSWLIMNHHDLSWIIMTYHESSWLIMNHHDLSWIMIIYDELWWPIISQRLSQLIQRWFQLVHWVRQEASVARSLRCVAGCGPKLSYPRAVGTGNSDHWPLGHNDGWDG